MKGAILTLIAAVALSGCSRTVVVQPDPSGSSAGPSTARTLGIPPGHLPPPGKCRIWIPGVPPGHQGPSGSCAALARRVPTNGLLVYRPTKNKKEVKVSVYHAHRPGVVVAIRYYSASNGKLLRQQSPE
jgi:hypothetical protein